MNSLLRTVKSSVIDIYQFVCPAAEAYLLTQMERGFHTLDFYKGLQTGSPVV